MPGRVSTPSDPSLEPEDWQKIWRSLKKLCLVTQRANSRLIVVTARPDDIFGDAVTFARYKNDIQRRKRYLDIEFFSSFVSISDVTHPASQSTELRIQWGACLLHLNQSESEGRNTRSRVSTRSSSSSYARSVRIAAVSSGPSRSKWSPLRIRWWTLCGRDICPSTRGRPWIRSACARYLICSTFN